VETINLPAEILEKCHQPIKLRYTPYLKNGFGIIIQRLTQTQITYSLFEQIARFHKQNPFDEIIFYTATNELSIMNVPTSIFPITSLGEHIGPVIATCPQTWYAMNNTIGDIEKYYYVFDPLIFRLLNPQLLNQISESNTKFILRCQEHQELVKFIPQDKIIKNYVPDAELELLKDIVNG